MEKIRTWYNDNYGEITWFLIGFCTLAGINSCGQGDYSGMLLNWMCAGLNYAFYRKGV